ncbi:MAG: glycoside hydrolase family 172 protein [Chloroflexota bacterium]
MSKRVLSLVAVLIVVAGMTPVNSAAPEPYGLDALLQFDRLPYLKADVQAGGQSSYDRTGGNEDSNHFLYTDAFGDQVLLDLNGPGTVYRLWVTGFANDARIKFYFDGETTPRVNMLLRDLFAGTNPPFLTPLVGNNRVSSGGFFSYVPMPFQQNIKITVAGVGGLFYYNIGYHVYSPETSVTTWTTAQDNTTAREMWNRAGQDPKRDDDNTTSSGAIDLAAGAAQTLFDVAGPRAIASLKLRVLDARTEHAVATDILNNVWLRIYWDDETHPSVFAPLGAFFALGHFGFYPTRSLAIGIDESDNLYVYFPMPFEKRAVVQLVNQRSVRTDNIVYEIQHKSFGDSFRDVGYFKTRYSFQSAIAGDGKDIVILDATGAGHLVGVVLSLQGKMNFDFLEGDERIFIDGNSTPALHGTGTEDFFNGGWYFENGPFTLPMHGSTFQATQNGYGKTAAYRLFLQDAIPFRRRIKVNLEHGGANDADAEVWSLAFFYH